MQLNRSTLTLCYYAFRDSYYVVIKYITVELNDISMTLTPNNLNINGYNNSTITKIKNKNFANGLGDSTEGA